MIIGSKQRLNHFKNDSITLKYEDICVEQCRIFKCLGIMIDENILWSDHVDYLCRKVFAGLAMLRRVKPYVDDISLKLLYTCLIQSQTDYCCEIWGNRFLSHIDKITKLQKRAARMILNCNMYTPSKELFTRMKWIPFQERVKYFRCIFVFKCLNDLSSDFHKDVFQEVSTQHNFYTRQCTRHDLIIDKCHTEYLKNAISYDGASLWNKLPSNIKQISNVKTFKLALKKYFFHLAVESG